jgi:Tannase and feruloyl esterase
MVKGAVCVPPNAAEMVAGVDAFSLVVATVKLALVAPSATTTLCVTVAAALLLERKTPAPPEGAAPRASLFPPRSCPQLGRIRQTSRRTRILIGVPRIVTTMGPDVPDFYRVFMAPGMAHCSGGAGVNAFGNGTVNGPVVDANHDLLNALERWVEQGVAPSRIVATHYVNNIASQGVQFQRPLCPYPQRGEYQGGDPNSADSFACVPHHDSFDPRNIGPQVAYEPEGAQNAGANGQGR